MTESRSGAILRTSRGEVPGFDEFHDNSFWGSRVCAAPFCFGACSLTNRSGNPRLMLERVSIGNSGTEIRDTKKAARRPLFWKPKNKRIRKIISENPSQTLFREAGTGGGTLAGLELRVGLADHIHRALAFHDLTVGVTALSGGEGRKDFHGVKRLGWSVGVLPTGARRLCARPPL